MVTENFHLADDSNLGQSVEQPLAQLGVFRLGGVEGMLLSASTMLFAARQGAILALFTLPSGGIGFGEGVEGDEPFQGAGELHAALLVVSAISTGFLLQEQHVVEDFTLEW